MVICKVLRNGVFSAMSCKGVTAVVCKVGWSFGDLSGLSNRLQVCV